MGFLAKVEKFIYGEQRAEIRQARRKVIRLIYRNDLAKKDADIVYYADIAFFLSSNTSERNMRLSQHIEAISAKYNIKDAQQSPLRPVRK